MKKIKYAKVVAGAGSGKTEVVKECYKGIVDENIKKGIDMSTIMKNIFMTTFTNAAAAEMKERIAGTYLSEGISVNQDDMEIMTFDSYHYRNICDNYEYFGYSEPPRVVDEVREKVIIADLISHPIISGLNYKEFTMAGGGALSVAYKIFDMINALGIDPSTKAGYDEVMTACADSDSSSIKKD